jgi:predicted Zn-dependent peptidase
MDKHIILPNGLHVTLLPKPDFHQMVAMVSVDFGSRDATYVVDGDEIRYPAGLAHFLEHKIFAQPDYDAFTRLSELGANANAFTTQTRTSYYFSARANNLAALQELLTFTMRPYFEDKAVTREAAIISQEIDMYQDDPNATMYRALLGVLYPNDALAEDIAGTRDSVAQITPKHLFTAFEDFYQANRLDVVLAGAFDENAVLSLIQSLPIGQMHPTHHVETSVVEVQPVPVSETEITIDTQRNKVALGQRWYNDVQMPTGRVALRHAIAISLAVDLVFSELSPTYMAWYDDGLIDDSFSAEFDWERGFAFLSLAAETPEVERLAAVLSETVYKFADEFDALSDDFEVVKKDAIGRLVSRFDSLEELVTRFEGATFEYATLSDELDILKELGVEDVSEILHTANVSDPAMVVARPKL